MTAFVAEHFYGCGRWTAPYWFIGVEAVMGKVDGGCTGDGFVFSRARPPVCHKNLSFL
jgi:hypothetical protein